MSRKTIFDAIRSVKGRIDATDVPVIDEALDKIGIARDDAPDHSKLNDPIPAGYFTILAQIESGNRPYVKAPTSSASGLFQFIKSTWQGEGGSWGANPSAAFGGLKPSEEEQRQRARSFTMKNVAALQARGLPVNEATLYACHFLGAGTAIRVLNAPDNAKADVLAGAAATRANPTILQGRTVAQFKDWLRRKTGVKP